MAEAGDLTYRPADGADIKTMWEIDQLCFEPDLAYPEDVFYYHLLVNGDPAFVAQDKAGKIAGFVMTALEGRGTGTIVTIDIVERWRGKGVGTKLMGIAESALAGRGAKKITLQTSVDNDVGVRFYEKLGYVNKKRIRDYYVKGKDAFLFEKGRG